MADRTIVGSLLITTQVQGGPFAAAMSRMSAVTAQQTANVRRSLNTTTASVQRLQDSGRRHWRMNGFLAASRAFNSLQSRTDQLRASLLGLTSVVGGFSAALATNAVISYADAYTEVQNRLRVVTDSQQELLMVQEALNRVSNEARVGIRESTILYSRLAVAAGKLGLNQQQLLDITETIQKAFVVGGSTPIEAAQSAIQLSQGIASNRLGGDELRSILENQALGQLLANAVTAGDLGKFRKLAEEGKLTANVLAKAFLDSRDKIREAFAEIRPSIAGAFTVLDNAITDYIGKTDEATGASLALIKGIQFVAANVEGVANALLLLGGIIATKFLAKAAVPLIARFALLATTLRGAIGAERAMRTAALAQTMAMTQQAVATQAAEAATLKAARAEAASAATNLRSSQTRFALARANQLVGVSASQAGAQVVAAQARMSAATSALTAATVAYTAAASGAAAAGVAQTAALAQTTRTATLAGAAMRGLAGIVAFLGGPLNVAVLAAAAGIYYLMTTQSKADQVAEAHGKTMENLRAQILGVASASAKEREELIKTMQVERAKAQLAVNLLAAERENILRLWRESRNFDRSIGERAMMTVDALLQTGRFNQLTTDLEAARTRVDNINEAWTELQQALNAPPAELSGLGAGDTTEKLDQLQRKLKELRIEAASGGLSPLTREVADIAREAGIAENAIQEFIRRVREGESLQGIDPNILEIRDLTQIINAWDRYEDILSEIGPTTAMVAEEQERLNFLIEQGAITARQGKDAFADWLSQFERYSYIDKIAESAGGLLESLTSISINLENIRITGPLKGIEGASKEIQDAVDGLSDFDQIVVDSAIKAGVAAPEILKFINAVKEGQNLNGIDPEILKIRNITMLKEGFDQAKEAVADFLKELAKMITQIIIIEPLVKSLRNALSNIGTPTAGGTTGGSWIANIIASLFGRATGGATGAPAPIVGNGALYDQMSALPMAAAPAMMADMPAIAMPAVTTGDQEMRVEIYNMNGSQVTAERKQDDNGLSKLVIMVDEATAANVQKRGSKTDQALNTRRAVIRR